MSKILITGASGFVGNAVAKNLNKQNEVVCLGRKNPELDIPWVEGNFCSTEDLHKLDKYDFDILVHLAAVTGGCSEEEGMMVNVEGSRRLMRYMIDKGCERFIMTSSIGVVGFQSPEFRPIQLPITEDHPCLDRRTYGFSKYMMEKITEHFWYQHQNINVINLRLPVVCDDNSMPLLTEVRPLGDWYLGKITILPLSEILRVYSLAVDSTFKSGVRTMNVVGKKAWTAVPVKKILENWWGNEVDLSCYDEPGHEYDSIFDGKYIEKELGFKYIP